MAIKVFNDLEGNGNELLNWVGGGGAVESGARVTISAPVTISNSTFTIVNFDGEDFDTDSYHDNVTNNERLTISENGLYIIAANFEFANNATGDRIATIRLNGTTTLATVRVPPATSFNTRLPVSTISQLTAGDYVEFGVDQISGGNLDLEPGNTWFAIARVGASGGGSGGRETLTANRTYFVDPAGNDSNDGLTGGTPFLTIQKAIDTVASIDPLSFDVSIQLADGTYTTTSDIVLKKTLAPTPVRILGNVADNTLVVIDNNSGTSSLGTFTADGVATYKFEDLTISNSAASTPGGNYCILIENNSAVILDNVRYLGITNTRGSLVQRNSTLRMDNAFDMEGGFAFGFVISDSSLVDMDQITYTLISTPSFSNQYAFLLNNSTYSQAGGGFSLVGTATGTRYAAVILSGIRTLNGLDTDVPGNAAGSLSSGSVIGS